MDWESRTEPAVQPRFLPLAPRKSVPLLNWDLQRGQMLGQLWRKCGWQLGAH